MPATLPQRLLWHGWRWTAFLKASASPAGAFLPRLVSVEPGQVRQIGNRPLIFTQADSRSLRSLAGRRVGGDWDLRTDPALEHPALRSFERHFLGGTAWEDTDYWRQIHSSVEAGRPRIGCRSPSDVRCKFATFDILWDALGTGDYNRPRTGVPYRPWEEVLVARARDGELVLVDGRHRLLMAYLKGVDLPAALILAHTRSRTD